MPTKPTKLLNGTNSKRPFIFIGVGIMNTALDFCFYTFLMLVVFKSEHVFLAGILSGTFALACAFTTHSLITWHGSKKSHKTLLKFILFTGFGMWVLRPLLLSIFSNFSGLYNWVYEISNNIGLPFSYEFIASTGAFGFMVIIVLTYNYLTYDRFVFNERGSTSPSTDIGQESH